jgi:putative membrane protein
MKKILLIPALSVALLMVACNGSESNTTSTDSVGRTDENTTAADTAVMVRNDTANTMANNNNNNADFLTEAASGGMMEVQLGQLAKTKASSQAVKDFAAMMVRDHSNANTQLKSIAAKKNVTLPAALPEKHQKHVTDLTEKSGADFDKDYMKMMVDDHQDDIKMFEKCAKDDKEDADIKAFAAKTLPTLYKHLDAAKAIRDKQQ